MALIALGFCQCGCGAKTTIADRTRPKFGHVKGMPMRFVRGHNSRTKEGRERRQQQCGENHPSYSGTFIQDGYRFVYAPDHPRALHGRHVAEHRLVAEQMSGRLLKRDEVVFHKNGDRLDNRPENLRVLTRAEFAREVLNRGV